VKIVESGEKVTLPFSNVTNQYTYYTYSDMLAGLHARYTVHITIRNV